ncbi:MAG: TolC family protein [Spirochaetaceae bacterium]|jgi:outer membrane protein TolC|nr:TolC family protein [Spirochaetaceae bacterium]
MGLPKGFSLLLVLLPLRLWAEIPGPPIGFEDAARMAAAASEDLRHEYALRALREGAWILGFRAYLPQLSIVVSEDDRLSLIGADSFLKSYSLKVDQLLWDGGRTSTNRAVERAELALLGSRLERMAGEIAEGAMAAYRNVLSARALLDIRRTAEESLSEQRRILAREMELGLALAIDLAEADITVAEARIAIRTISMELEEAERQLAETLGLTVLPELRERVDTGRSPVLPGEDAVRSFAQARHPGLAQARHVIAQRQAEAKYAARSWLPTVRINGGFGLSGQRYPLSKYNWSLGISVNFSSPYFSGGTGGSMGWDPPYDRDARLQHTLTPLPDPSAALTGRQAVQALALERAKYAAAFEQAGRMAVISLEKCRFAEERRALAMEALELTAERYRLSELRLELGQLTRIELMEARIDYAQKEAASVEAAAGLLEAERELERFLDLPPGGLAEFARREIFHREISRGDPTWSGL